MKNPLLNVDEEISIQPGQQIPFFEKIGLFCALIISIVVLIFSALSFMIDLFSKSAYLMSMIDVTMFVISLASIYFIYQAFKRRFITDILIDTAVQDGIYSRLQPLIENIAEANIGADVILERLSNIDSKVQNILQERYSRESKFSDFTREPVAVGTSIKFTFKAIFLITITMAAFMFLLNFHIGAITSYAVLLIFVMWWLFITNEFSLWRETFAWTFVFFVLLVVPITVMLFGNLMNYNVLMAAIYVSLGLFVFAYYIWAVYAATGSLPIIITQKPDLLRQKPEENRFFSTQQNGMIKEILDDILTRLEQRSQKERKTQESGYVWRK